MDVTLVISGSGRGAGKTAVGCALIQALAEWEWIAVKITPDIHAESEGGKEFAGEVEASCLPRVSAEKNRSSRKSTSRYLAAGARRALLVTVAPEWNGERLAELDAALEEGVSLGNLLVESNRFSGAARICLAVTGVTQAKWKKSYLKCVDKADALVLTNGIEAGNLPVRLRSRPVFVVRNGDWAPAELVEFVRGRLAAR